LPRGGGIFVALKRNGLRHFVALFAFLLGLVSRQGKRSKKESGGNEPG